MCPPPPRLNRVKITPFIVCDGNSDLSLWFVWLIAVNIDTLEHSRYSKREHIHAINLRRQSGFLCH